MKEGTIHDEPEQEGLDKPQDFTLDPDEPTPRGSGFSIYNSFHNFNFCIIVNLLSNLLSNILILI